MDTDVRDRLAAARGFAPFGGAALLAWVTVPVGMTIDWSRYLLASGLLVFSVALRMVRIPAPRSPGLGGVVPSLIFLASLDLLRSSAGGINAGVSAVAVIPVFYIALHSEGRRDLYLVLVGLAVFYLAPIILVGPPSYPHTQYRAALLSVAVSAIIGRATQRLVADVRHKAGEARARERMLEEVSQVLRDLYSSSRARIDVCEAAKRIGDATCAILYEPLGDSGAMRSTAIVGLEAPPIEIPADRDTAVRDAFRSGRASLITEDLEAHVGSPELWRAAGCPRAVLYEPLMRGSRPIGVLVVGWSGEVRATGPRAMVVELLAHEAATVIQRADMMNQLTDMAQTDSLTGLPNRRAWDARLSRVSKEGRQFTIAMLDLDHFKDYNDTFGHPAGDRLLKETAAMWRHQLRGGDLLARLGGEEFGLLLLDCDRAHALDVIERLRGAVYSDRTCSAGFAEQRAEESVEEVMARADQALYEAKTAGRDRIRMSI